MQNEWGRLECTKTEQYPNNPIYKIHKSKFLSVLQFSTDVIFILDNNGHIKFANDAFFRFTGISRSGEAECLKSIRLQDIISVKRDKYKFLLGNREWQGKVVFHTKKSSIVRVSLKTIPITNNRVTAIDHLCIVNWNKRKDNILHIGNIKHKKESSKKNQYLEKQFNSVWENSNDGMCLVDKHGNITFFNDALCRIFDIKAEEIKGRPFYKLLNLNNARDEEIFSKFQKQDFVKKIKKHFNIKVVLKSNRTVELDVCQSFMENNGSSFLLNIFNDITKIKEAERALQKNQKMTEIGKVASFIVHELKSPLACLKMNIDLLLRKTLNTEQTDKVLKILQKEINRLNSVLSEISEFNKQHQLQKTEIYLFKIVEIIRVLIIPVLEKRSIAFENKIDGALKINGDEQKLQTVIIHLLENSIDAIGENGAIEISSAYDSQLNRVSIFIKDTGCGVKNREKIFEPFYTTKPSGVGLGLSIVKHIIEQHNGDIRLISGIPGETVFELSFNCEVF